MTQEADRPSILFLSNEVNQKVCMVNQQRIAIGSLIVLVILSILHRPAVADTFGSGDNTFDIEVVTIGFRVASSVPEPSTLLLLCFGSSAALWRRRDANSIANGVPYEVRDANSRTLRIGSNSKSPKSRSPVRKASAR